WFALPAGSRKADPALLREDEARFARIREALDRSLSDLARRREQLLRPPARDGQERLERDAEARRLSVRHRLLSRVSQDACLGRILPADGTGTLYIGRTGLADAEGRPLLVDWRSPAAEPFFAATRARPMG